MLRYAFLSLRKDYKQALFYWLIFVLTSFFVFSIFNLSLNENQLLSISGGTGFTLISFMLIAVIVVTMYASFSANHYYVTTKSKELAINLISGATFTQIIQFLMIQNAIIMFTSIPFGVFLGYLSIPLQRYILNVWLGIPLMISVSSDSLNAAILVILFILFWCIVLNFSYAYGHTVSELLREGKNISLFKKRIIPDLAYLILFVFGLILIVFNGSTLGNYFIFTVVGVIGLYGMNKYYIPRMLTILVHTQGRKDARTLIYLNYLKTNMKKMNLPVMVLVLSTGLLIASMAFYYPLMETMVGLFSYYMIVLLMSFSIVLKYIGIIEERVKDYKHLYHFGYTKTLLKEIALKEVSLFFILLWGLSSIYSYLILMKLYLSKIMSFSFVFGIMISTMAIFILMFMISYFYYRYRLIKTIDKKN